MVICKEGALCRKAIPMAFPALTSTCSEPYTLEGGNKGRMSRTKGPLANASAAVPCKEQICHCQVEAARPARREYFTAARIIWESPKAHI